MSEAGRYRTTRKLPGHEPQFLVWTPLRDDPSYRSCPGAISITTTPPRATEIAPACTPAVQTEESSEYGPEPQIELGRPPDGHRYANRSPVRPRYDCGVIVQLASTVPETPEAVPIVSRARRSASAQPPSARRAPAATRRERRVIGAEPVRGEKALAVLQEPGSAPITRSASVARRLAA